MALTGKKRVFADAVLAGRSNKEAAIAAGYSAATASAAGSRLVKDADVSTYIAGRRATPVAPPSPPVPAGLAPSDPEYDFANGTHYVDPMEFLIAAMNAPELEPRQRIDSAKALLPFTHKKLGEGGKKEEKQSAADAAAKDRFKPSAAPKLVVSNK